LSRLAGRQRDAFGVVALAEGKDPASVELDGNYAAGELDAMVSVMRKLLGVRDVVLKVNAEYIRSAAQADEFRTEPPFKLQGSYRNMNRIAEKVLPVMNDAELDELIRSSYRNDAQTLTTGAEANLLKFRELVGWLSEDDAKRWEEIKQTFRRNQKLRGVDQSDRFGQAVAQLSLFADGLTELRETLSTGIDRLADRPAAPPSGDGPATLLAERLDAMREAIAALGGSIGEGLSRVAASDGAPREGHRVDPDLLRQILESLRPAAPAVRVVAEETGGPAAVPSTITVVNKIPPTLLNVLREQFRLMETWLKPLLSASQRQSAEMAELAAQIKTCLADYERLVGRIESAR
ncbi:MAG TPA: AAA family ATPase, partial [Planctomycetaceae bacterium]